VGFEFQLHQLFDHIGPQLVRVLSRQVHARGGPQAIGPAVVKGPKGQQGIQLAQLLVGQARGRAVLGRGSQAVRTALGGLSPAIEGVRLTPRMRATTVSFSPWRTRSTAKRRRRSSSAGVPMGLLIIS
jgi:hypothetical protein